jgi:hypothetical protein
MLHSYLINFFMSLLIIQGLLKFLRVDTRHYLVWVGFRPAKPERRIIILSKVKIDVNPAPIGLNTLKLRFLTGFNPFLKS